MLMRPKSEMRNVKRKARIAMLVSAFAAGQVTRPKTMNPSAGSASWCRRLRRSGNSRHLHLPRRLGRHAEKASGQFVETLHFVGDERLNEARALPAFVEQLRAL